MFDSFPAKKKKRHKAHKYIVAFLLIPVMYTPVHSVQ